MPLDEQDAKFEQALRRHLRSECPDAETLAAYHERTLAPEELILWKEHVVKCAVCQEILAELERTDRLPLEAESDLLPVEWTAKAEAPRGARDLGARSVEAPAPAAAKVAQMRRPATWRWAAPAGALAAGLLVWLAVKDQNRAVLLPKPAPQVAVDQKARASSSESGTTPSEEGRENEALKDQQHATPSKPAPEQDGALRKPEGLRSERVVSPETSKVAPPAVQVRPDLAKEKNDAPAKLQSKANADKGLDRDFRSKTAQSADVSAEMAAPPPAPIDESNSRAMAAGAAGNAPAPASAPVPATGEAKKRADIGLLRQQNANAGNMVGGYKQEGYLADGLSSLHGVRSDDGKTLWTFGSRGRIERASSESRKWITLESGVEADLLAGSAPSDKICWIVGRSGTILRTTDGGEHWDKIVSPVGIDWEAVRATDARQAVISNASHSVRYETKDGGVNWKLATSP